jgi:AcrR family transcriptional regulator
MVLTPTGIILQDPPEGADRIDPRNTGRPTRNAAAALPDRILDAAQALFLAQGFEATSLNQIAARAGSTKRTLYVKVGDKAELFAAVVRRMLNDRRRKLSHVGKTATARESLTRFGENLLAIALDPDVLRLYRLIIAEAPRFPALASLMQEQVDQGARSQLAALLRAEALESRLDVADPETAAQLFVAMVIGAPQQAVLFGMKPWGRTRRADWVRAAVALFLDGSGPAAC